MDLQTQIRDFMAGSRFAVAGASTNRAKYGNKVLRLYQQLGHDVVPINPTASRVEGLSAVSAVTEIDPPPHGLSIITPPQVTDHIVDEAIAQGVLQIWMQPGADSKASVWAAERAGVNLIYGGPCILVALGYHEGNKPRGAE